MLNWLIHWFAPGQGAGPSQPFARAILILWVQPGPSQGLPHRARNVVKHTALLLAPSYTCRRGLNWVCWHRGKIKLIVQIFCLERHLFSFLFFLSSASPLILGSETHRLLRDQRQYYHHLLGGTQTAKAETQSLMYCICSFHIYMWSQFRITSRVVYFRKAF